MRTAGRDVSPSKVPITTHVLKRLTDEAPRHSATVIGPLRAAAAAVLRRSSGEAAASKGGGAQQGEMATSLIADSTAPPSDVHQTPYHVQV